MFEFSWSKPLVKNPLRPALIAILVTQILLVAALIGYFSFRSGHEGVSILGDQLVSEISARIGSHLRNFLGTPHRINQMNVNLIRQDVLDARKPKTLEHHFWGQVGIFDSVTSVYFGNAMGGMETKEVMGRTRHGKAF
jgi:hypothetical protein